MIEVGKIQEIFSKYIKNGKKLSLELGCGDRKRHPNAIGIDVLDYKGVDIVGDIYDVLKNIPEGSIDTVYSYHCFEHLNDLGAVMEQLCRIMDKSGILLAVVPHFSNPYFYSDYTHKQFFGLYTFSYLAKDNLFALRCPTYQRTQSFKIEKVKLIFKSPKPFYGRYGFKKIVQWFVNLNRYTMEFYEENLCWLIPCYEIHFELRRFQNT